MPVLEQDIWDKLKECVDPELPCNIVDLGLVYAVRVQPLPGTDRQRADVTMTLTTPACPMAAQIAAQVQQKLLELPGLGAASVQLVYDPPWQVALINAAGRQQLGMR